MTDRSFALTLVGDLIGPGRPVVPQATAELDEVFALLRSSEAGFANHEGTIFDIEDFAGSKAAEHGGGYPLNRSNTAADLKAMGISAVSKANNHATDWGVEGLLESLRHLTAAGVAYAGAGVNHGRAREAGYVEHASARTALVSVATTFTPMSPAGAPEDHSNGRPGINVLRLTPVTLVPEEDWALFESIAVAQGADREIGSRAARVDGDLVIGAEKFRRAHTGGLAYDLNPADLASLRRSVRHAAQTADFVIVMVHAHETQSGAADDPLMPEALRTALHACIDEGADVVALTGPHDFRGIELYRGKPVFGSLGTFFFEMEGGFEPSILQSRAVGEDRLLTAGEYIRRLFDLPANWYESAVVTVHVADSRPVALDIHPIQLSRRDDTALQGEPRRATGADAERILARIAALSAELGTTMSVEGGVGHISLAH